MRVRPIVWLIILLLGIAPATQRGFQSAQQTGLPSNTEKSVIQGVVTELPAGAPLKGAEVFLTAGNRCRSLYRTETDATGQFSLSDVEPGKCQIWIPNLFVATSEFPPPQEGPQPTTEANSDFFTSPRVGTSFVSRTLSIFANDSREARIKPQRESKASSRSTIRTRLI
jgi:hypothetical protein